MGSLIWDGAWNGGPGVVKNTFQTLLAPVADNRV